MLLHHYRFEPDTSLYDLDLFRTELAGSRSPIAPFKAALREIQARLDERFRAGSDIRDLVRGRAWYLDQLLAIAWAQHAWPDDGVALVAVGDLQLPRRRQTSSDVDFRAFRPLSAHASCGAAYRRARRNAIRCNRSPSLKDPASAVIRSLPPRDYPI